METRKQTVKRSKTWHIGETALYGTWRGVVQGETVSMNGYRYRTHDVQETRTFPVTDSESVRRFLLAVMTPYHADQVTTWIDSINGKGKP